MNRPIKKLKKISLKTGLGLITGTLLLTGLIGVSVLSRGNQDVRSNAVYSTSIPLPPKPTKIPSNPVPRVSPSPSVKPSVPPPPPATCKMGGTVVQVGQCGCNISGYESKLCIAQNVSINNPNSCYAQCHKTTNQENDCNKIGDPEPTCSGKKIGDTCGSVKNFSCQLVHPSRQDPYCDCLIKTQ